MRNVFWCMCGIHDNENNYNNNAETFPLCVSFVGILQIYMKWGINKVYSGFIKWI